MVGTLEHILLGWLESETEVKAARRGAWSKKQRSSKFENTTYYNYHHHELAIVARYISSGRYN
jgi:hypothetical protein